MDYTHFFSFKCKIASYYMKNWAGNNYRTMENNNTCLLVLFNLTILLQLNKTQHFKFKKDY